MFITSNHGSFHLWLKDRLAKHKKVSKFLDHDYLQNFLLLFMFFLTASFVKSSSHILAGFYFMFLKQRPGFLRKNNDHAISWVIEVLAINWKLSQLNHLDKEFY